MTCRRHAPGIAGSLIALWLAMAGAIVVWIAVPVELVDVAAIAALWGALTVALVALLKGRHRSRIAMTAVVAVVSALAMMYCRGQAGGRTDRFAAEFLRTHACAPSFEALLADGKSWKRDRGNLLVADISFLGASRRVSYQDNGLLRYGFLYDDTRAVWLPQCRM